MYKARLENMRMKKLELSDQRHMDAAQGWLGLGNWLEANEELEQITPLMRAHPDVLLVRWHVYATAKKWEMAADIARAISEQLPENPFGWVHWAFSLHELKRTKEAWDVLVPVVDKFPDEYIIRYNLACYACQLGNLKEALQWLKKAIDLAGKKDIRTMALDDPDLQPLWNEIGEI
ncbi:MAG: tetratricopeptide repeat protein [Verrucomicrobiota bacterium]|jgi:predicted Zn-dependent protease